MANDERQELKPWKEPVDYKPMIDRAKIINEIWEWYHKKYEGKSGVLKISVSDLIADFIIENGYTRKGQ